MRILTITALTAFLFQPTFLMAAESGAAVLVDDDFDRTETDDSKEQIGGSWSTNSRSRAKGNKQVDLKDGAMHIVRHEVADHGVSVVHEAAFKDAVISARIKLGDGDQIGFNIADMKEKSVHAGHICLALIRLDRVEMVDLKTGRMELGLRERRKAGQETPMEKKMVRSKTKKIAHKLKPNQWHHVMVTIKGETMTIAIDGDKRGSFTSEGIGHPSKSRLRLAVERSAWVDDLRLERL